MGIGLSGIFVSANAHAQTLAVTLSPTLVSTSLQLACNSQTSISNVVSVAIPESVKAAKSRAILGGELSALERMKLQQSGSSVTVAEAPAAPTAEVLRPAAGGVRPMSSACQWSAKLRMPDITPAVPQEPDSQNFLASKRVGIERTMFDQEWQRVGRAPIANYLSSELNFEKSVNTSTLESVNRWVNRNVTYVEDNVLYNRADYWAGANRTLTLKMGDCEDIALAKLQLLADAGFKREDMFLAIVKDTVRRADHALLVVRIDDSFVILDNATDALLDGAHAHGYKPIVSYSADTAWLHGY